VQRLTAWQTPTLTEIKSSIANILRHFRPDLSIPAFLARKPLHNVLQAPDRLA
jgi:hypothetical protein